MSSATTIGGGGLLRWRILWLLRSGEEFSWSLLGWDFFSTTASDKRKHGQHAFSAQRAGRNESKKSYLIRHFSSALRSRRLSDAVEHFVGAKQQVAVGNSGGSLKVSAEWVSCQNFEFRAALEDGGCS